MSSNWSRTAWLSLVLLTACSGGGAASSATPAASPPVATSMPSPSSTATPSAAPTAAVPQRLEPALPAARQETAAANLAGELVVVGGFDPQRRSSNSVYVLRAGGWQAGPVYPIAIDHASAAVVEGHLYVAGGFSDGPAQAAVYSLQGSSWKGLASLNHARGALALVVAGGRLYAIGGNATDNVSAVERYDPAGNAWVDVANLPQPRNHLAGFNFKGLVCVAGGRSPGTPRVDCLDPAAGTWSRLPDLPAATIGAGAVVLNGRVLVAGGETGDESALVPLVFRFDGAAWTSEAMLSPRHGFELAVVGGRAWACGGASSPGYGAVADCTSIA